ncbi:MAG: hypothetical protein Q9170_001517 [Blastenia crenularia]
MFPTKKETNLSIAVLNILIFLITLSQSNPINDLDSSPSSYQYNSLNPPAPAPHARDHLQSQSESNSLLPFNTTTLIFTSYQQLSSAAAPIISAIYAHFREWSQESVVSGKPIADTIICAYGLLDFVIVSLQKISIPWDAVEQITSLLAARVGTGMVGFFNAYWEVAQRLWVYISLGVPPHK